MADLCRNADNRAEVGFLVLVVQTVALFTKNLRGSFDGFFLIEFNAQHAALVLPVMDDADVFDADIFYRKAGYASFLVKGDGEGHGSGLRNCRLERETEPSLE